MASERPQKQPVLLLPPIGPALRDQFKLAPTSMHDQVRVAPAKPAEESA
jgi:hypothetical protein